MSYSCSLADVNLGNVIYVPGFGKETLTVIELATDQHPFVTVTYPDRDSKKLKKARIHRDYVCIVEY